MGELLAVCNPVSITESALPVALETKAIGLFGVIATAVGRMPTLMVCAFLLAVLIAQTVESPEFVT
jgi:hypothetical protein